MSAPAKILVVDDEEELRLAVVKTLQRAGYEVSSAAGGAEALEKLSAGAVDLVVSDFLMPEMDGVELLRRVGQTRSPVRFIIVTGHGTIEKAVEAMRLGATDFLEKPLNRAALLDAVSKALGRAPPA